MLTRSPERSVLVVAVVAVGFSSSFGHSGLRGIGLPHHCRRFARPWYRALAAGGTMLGRVFESRREKLVVLFFGAVCLIVVLF